MTRPPNFALLPWRTGRRVGRTVYVVPPDGPDPNDGACLIGVMDTAELAAHVVWAHNQTLSPRPPDGPWRPNPSVPENARWRWRRER